MNKIEICILIIFAFFLTEMSNPFIASAQDDIFKLIEKKQAELREKEIFLRQEEKRLQALKKEVEEKVEKYNNILTQIDNLIKKLEYIKEQNFEHIVKTYENMPAEEAAERLSSINEELLVKILLKMKPKKTAAIIAAMDSKKAAAITQSMSTIEKKFPIR